MSAEQLMASMRLVAAATAESGTENTRDKYDRAPTTVTGRPAQEATEPAPTGSAGQGDDATVAQQPDEVAVLSDRIRQALECPVCLEVRADLKCYCPHGHAVCGRCLGQIHNTSTTVNATALCPMCRSPMMRTMSAQITAGRMGLILPFLRLGCRYRQHGCGAMFRVYDAAHHEIDCRYWPEIRCLVTACQWLGTHNRLYEHVSREHPGSITQTKGNRLVVTDVDRITSSSPRTYLVKTDRGDALLWVLMSRESRNRIKTGVFTVESKRGMDDRKPPTTVYMNFRIFFWHQGSDCMGQRVLKTRSRTRKVGRWYSLLQPTNDRDDKSGSYTKFMSRQGRVEVSWFERARTDSRDRAPQNQVAEEELRGRMIILTAVDQRTTVAQGVAALDRPRLF